MTLIIATVLDIFSVIFLLKFRKAIKVAERDTNNRYTQAGQEYLGTKVHFYWVGLACWVVSLLYFLYSI